MHMRHLMSLSYVRDHDGGPQQELAEALCMDANNVVLLLNELEELGYISRLRDPSDRRRHLVELTPVGAKALDDAEHRQEAIEDEVLGALDSDERATLWRLLGRALRGAEPELDEACERRLVSAAAAVERPRLARARRPRRSRQRALRQRRDADCRARGRALLRRTSA